jgi:hypothetical protein
MAIDSGFFTPLDIHVYQLLPNSSMFHAHTHLSVVPCLLHLSASLFLILPLEFTIESDVETSSVGSNVDRTIPASKSPPVFNVDSSTSTTSPNWIDQWKVAPDPSYRPPANVNTNDSLLLGTCTPFLSNEIIVANFFGLFNPDFFSQVLLLLIIPNATQTGLPMETDR